MSSECNRFGSSLLGSFTFFAREHGTDECDTRGLPLTPNSILITGLFQELLQISHDNLCVYLDLIKCADERLICVSQYYSDSVETYLQQRKTFGVSTIHSIASNVLQGLAYLHDKSIIMASISSDTVKLTPEGTAKLFNYGLHHMTSRGTAVNFSIWSPRYMPPEVLVSGQTGCTKSDMWSLGILLLEMYMEQHIYPELFLKNGLQTLFTRILRLVQSYHRSSINPLTALLETHGFGNRPMDLPLRNVIDACLCPIPSKRLSANDMLGVHYQTLATETETSKRDPFVKNHFKCKNLTTPSAPPPPSTLAQAHATMSENYLSHCSIQEVYYLWKLAGGDMQNEIAKKSLIKTRPPILGLPILVTHQGDDIGEENTISNLYNDAVIVLPLVQLYSRLEKMTVSDYYPILPDPNTKKDRMSMVQMSKQLLETSKLPLLIKECDIEYQFHRVVLYHRLLQGYPYTQDMIITEAIVDVCPLMRGYIWAALLHVKGDIQDQYIHIDKDTPTQTDRQIAVDIPRCHQYDFLLASTQGHLKFTRILKAWIKAHRKLVYWQGLDSLCAPFLALNFNNEALALASLSEFIDKYLYHFFLKDNSPVMQEYLAIFSQIISYHDPELFNHLDSIGFLPDLYAIPWFLTMFTHVFPLHKIYHLWDTLLLGNCSFPLFAGLAILSQLRNELLMYDFNECILMFSDLPEVDIQDCVTLSIQKYQTTPTSLYIRKHESSPIQHSAIPQQAKKECLPLEVLRLESSPQISAHDVVALLDLEKQAFSYDGGKSCPSKDHNDPLLWKHTNTNSKQKVVVVDIRPQEQYQLGHVMGSVNAPFDGAFTADGSLQTDALDQYRGRIMVVLGNKGDPTATFARQLVRLNFSKVCCLHGGAGVMRSLGLLSSLN